MSQVRKNKQSLGSKIMQYRKIILLALFFIILPVFLVIGIYSGTKANGEKVRFSEEKVLKSKKFDDISNFNEFHLTLTYTEISTLFDAENTDEKIGNTYTFTILYEEYLHHIENVTVTAVLVAPWSTYQEVKAPLVLTEGRTHTISVDFKKEVPYKPLWFVEIEHPILYLEVSYMLNGFEQIRHLKYDLALGNPRVK